MAKLVWNEIQDRRFETGIERGALYPLSGAPAAWNGLVSVAEGRAREVKSFFRDGVKYLDVSLPGSYSAKIQAFTYPDVLEELVGTRKFAPGVNLHDQPAKMFHLSYRTLVGDVLEGTDHGYKLHLLYDLTVTPGDTTFTTMGDQVTPMLFEWTVSGASNHWMVGIRPSNHISIDSRYVDPVLLEDIERDLYGYELDGATYEPRMPDFQSLLEQIAA